MPRSLSILLLCAYLVASLRPYLPHIDYQLRMEYYAEVLCQNKALPELHCNGKCVLAQKLKKAAEASLPEAPQAPNGPKSEDFLATHLPASSPWAPFLALTLLTAEAQTSYAGPSLAPPTPPPNQGGSR